VALTAAAVRHLITAAGTAHRKRLTRQQDQQAGKTESLPNPGQCIQVKPSRHHAAVKAQVSEAIRRGVEIWQVNFGLDDTGVRVLSYHELTRQLAS